MGFASLARFNNMINSLKFQILALSFDHHPLSRNWAFFQSETSCFVAFTGPLVAWPLLSLSHSLATYCELILRSLSLQKHSVLSASSKLVTKGLFLIAAWPFGLVALALAPHMTNFQQICYKPWTMTYWAIIMACLALLTALLLMAFGLGLYLGKKAATGKEDTTSLISSSSYQSARFGGCQSVQKKASSGLTGSPTTAFVMMVHTVDPPPFLDLSLKTANLLNFAMNVLLYLPCVVHMRPLAFEAEKATVKAEMAANDAFLLWTYVLILIGGSVTPVLHLMTDEALSSLGLDIVRKKARFWGHQRPIGLVQGQGHINETCNDTL